MNMMRIKYCRLITLFAVIGSLAGCGGSDVSDLETYIANSKLKYKGNIEALPQIAPYEVYRYHADGKRDPFKPTVSLVKSLAINRIDNGINPDTGRVREELEKYSLDTLHMVGTMLNDGVTWGIIRAPNNAIYRVRKGNYMGQNYGKIVAITETKIELREIVPDGRGGWNEQPNTVKLSQ
jgi:type IV pilus assembly protein PilP